MSVSESVCVFISVWVGGCVGYEVLFFEVREEVEKRGFLLR